MLIVDGESEAKRNEKVMLFVKEQASLTVSKSFEGASIRSLLLEKHDVFSAINNLLYATSMALNVANNLNSFQAFDIVQTIINDYADCKIDELVYIFKQGKKGIYGPHYNKLDIETIINWINSFYASEEHNNFIENRHRTPVEKVVLTQEQKDNWKKTLESFKALNPEKTTETILSSFTNEELNNLLAEYTALNFEDGIKTINKELNKRSK